MKLLRESHDSLEIEIGNGSVTTISPEDKELMTEFPAWQSCDGHVWIYRYIPTKYGVVYQRIYLHRAIMMRVHGLDRMKAFETDHKDRNRLNNKRDNLRHATSSQNKANRVAAKSSSGFRGVTKITHKSLKKPFCAMIVIPGTRKGKNLGYFKTAEEAARVWDLKAKETFGEFAMLNFPDEK